MMLVHGFDHVAIVGYSRENAAIATRTGIGTGVFHPAAG